MPGSILQRLCDTSLEACQGFVPRTTGPRCRTGPVLETNELRKSRNFLGIRSGLRTGGLATTETFISSVTWRVLVVTIAIYSYDYGYDRGYRYTSAESTPRYYTDPCLLAHSSRNMTDNWDVGNIIVITIILVVCSEVWPVLFLSIGSSAIDRVSGRGNCARNMRSSSHPG